MTTVDLPNYLTATALLAASSVSSTANGSVVLDLVGYEGTLAVTVNAGAASAGTNPTLDLVFKKSSDNSTFSNANVTFTQITGATTQTVGIDTRAVSRYLRLDRVIGGTNSPAFPVCVIASGIKQYNPT